METLDRIPAFDINPDGTSPTIFDALGTDFDQWKKELDETSPVMKSMESSPTSGARSDGTEASTDYDWD